jgi:RNA polymerase sigma-70 factor (ECF subfamily)
MTMSDQPIRPNQDRLRRFTPTNWSVVLAAGGAGSPEAHDALARLCQRYWYPLYAYVRRLGHSTEEAEDLIQEFFARLIKHNWIAKADPHKGRFRSFLLMVLKRFLGKERDHSNRLRRGSGQTLVSLDAQDAESRYLAEPAGELTPDKSFDRCWAWTLLEQVLKRLEAEWQAAGEAVVFQELRIFLTGEEADTSYAEIAQRLQMTEGTLRVTIYRLRRRYRERLWMEIEKTVATPEQAEEEMHDLVAALSS